MTFVEQISFLKKLNRLADEAAKHDIALGNGGDVSSQLGAIATDLEYVWDIQKRIRQNLEKLAKGGAQ